MTLESLVRLSGLALLIGGGLAALGWSLFAILDPGHLLTAGRQWLVLNFFIIFGGVFMAMGLPGIYAAEVKAGNILRLVGFILLFIGIVIPYVAVHSIETTTSPNIPAGMSTLVAIGAPSLSLGAVVTGIVVLASDLYPVWLAMGLIISVLLGLLGQFMALPPALTRGIFPAIFTAVMAIIGFYTYTR